MISQCSDFPQCLIIFSILCVQIMIQIKFIHCNWFIQFVSKFRLTCLFKRFLYFWPCWIFVAACGLACGLSLVAVSRGYSSSQCMAFSLRGLLLPQRTGSRTFGRHWCCLWALELWLSSCGAWASSLRSTWGLPRSGMGPVSPVLLGKLLTTYTTREAPELYNF